jgi:hypothetical protein
VLSEDANALRLLDFLYQNPVLSVQMAQEHLGCSYGRANSLISRFEKAGILREFTGRPRNRRFRYDPYLALFDQQALPDLSPEEQGETKTTLSRGHKA